MSNPTAAAAHSANHVTLDGDKLARRDAAYECSAAHVVELSTPILRELIDSYTSVRAQLHRDSTEWWAVHGAILAARDELRDRELDEQTLRSERHATTNL